MNAATQHLRQKVIAALGAWSDADFDACAAFCDKEAVEADTTRVLLADDDANHTELSAILSKIPPEYHDELERCLAKDLAQLEDVQP